MAERYVSALAVGGGGGTVGAPWTWAEMVAAINGGAVNNGDRCNVKADGVYTVADFIITRSATAQDWIIIQGYTAAIGDGGRPTLQRAAAEVGSWCDWGSSNAFYYELTDLVFDGNGVGDTTGTALDLNLYTIVTNVEIKNTDNSTTVNARNGHTKFSNCSVHDIVGNVAGISFGYWVNSRVYNVPNQLAINGSWVNSVLRAGPGGTWVAQNSYFTNSVIDVNNQAGRHGVYLNGIFEMLNCVILNASGVGAVALSFQANSKLHLVKNCNFWNNTNDFAANMRITSPTYLDPEFVDPSTMDYTRDGQNLDDIGLSRVGLETDDPNYAIDIGPFQWPSVDLPAAAQVLNGISFGFAGALQTGSLDAVSFEYPIDVVVEDEELVVEVGP